LLGCYWNEDEVPHLVFNGGIFDSGMADDGQRYAICKPAAITTSATNLFLEIEPPPVAKAGPKIGEKQNGYCQGHWEDDYNRYGMKSFTLEECKNLCLAPLDVRKAAINSKPGQRKRDKFQEAECTGISFGYGDKCALCTADGPMTPHNQWTYYKVENAQCSSVEDMEDFCDGTGLRVTAVKCSGPTCNKAKDQITCCNPPAKCDSITDPDAVSTTLCFYNDK